MLQCSSRRFWLAPDLYLSPVRLCPSLSCLDPIGILSHTLPFHRNITIPHVVLYNQLFPFNLFFKIGLPFQHTYENSLDLFPAKYYFTEWISTFVLSMHQLIDTWVLSPFWLLWILLLAAAYILTSLQGLRVYVFCTYRRRSAGSLGNAMERF